TEQYSSLYCRLCPIILLRSFCFQFFDVPDAINTFPTVKCLVTTFHDIHNKALCLVVIYGAGMDSNFLVIIVAARNNFLAITKNRNIGIVGCKDELHIPLYLL